MGKDGGFLTPKAISNRIKAKGLQKLKFYCQMCEKQCRDANGFKCHCQSEGHRRQMTLVSQGKNKFVQQFSREFERGFMNIVRTRFRHKTVKANHVYNQYISDRNHVHMTGTNWQTLSGFVGFLTREGKVTSEETPKGLFLRYIDRDQLAKDEASARKHKEVMNNEERLAEEIETQKVLAAKLEEESGISKVVESTNLIRTDPDSKVTIALGSLDTKRKKVSIFEEEEEEKAVLKEKEEETKKEESTIPSAGSKRSLKDIKDTQEQKKSEEPPKKKKKVETLPYWLHKDIVVKVKLKTLAGGKFYKQKGIVREVVDHYAAKVEMIHTGKSLLLDQEHVESVIPALGAKVMVVNGTHRGLKGSLLRLLVEEFSGVILLETDEQVKLPYEHFSKLKSK